MSLAEVKEFHEAFGHPVAQEPILISPERFALRLTLIREELEETREAWEDADLVKYVDGLADLGVVTNGTILEFGGTTNGVDPIPNIWDDGRDVPHMSSEDKFYSWHRTMERVIQVAERCYENGNVYGVLDALERISYATAAHAYYNDVPLLEINEAVHKANMSKLGLDGKPVYRKSDNKILKGPNFRPPEEDIKRILREHGAEL